MTSRAESARVGAMTGLLTPEEMAERYCLQECDGSCGERGKCLHSPGRRRRGGAVADSDQHPDPRVHAALTVWGDSPDGHGYRAARLLFPDFESLRSAYQRILPKELHHRFHELEVIDLGDSTYHIAGIIYRLAKLDVTPETLEHAVEYMRMRDLASYDIRPYEWDEVRRAFNELCKTDASYVRELDLGFTHPSLLVPLFQAIHVMREKGIPSDFVRQVCADEQWGDASRALAVYEAGVPASALAIYPTWPPESVIELHNAGVPPRYAGPLRDAQWRRRCQEIDSRAIARLWNAAVPQDYATAGVSAGLVDRDIIACFEAAVPIEFMTAMPTA